MLTPTGSTVGKRLRQVQTHVGFQFHPHRPPVLRSRLHHRLFHSLLPQPRQKAVQLARHRGRIAAALVSLPASSHPRQPPSTLSCVRQSPRPSSLPPGVEAAERTRKRLHTVTCYHLSYSEQWRDTDWFKTRVPDQTQKRPHFIQSVNRPL